MYSVNIASHQAQTQETEGEGSVLEISHTSGYRMGNTACLVSPRRPWNAWCGCSRLARTAAGGTGGRVISPVVCGAKHTLQVEVSQHWS
jgi:hypothetical protein